MAIGERIRFLRNLKGMTQKWLGMAVGFDEKTADLNVPNIDSYVGLMHTLFALEDIYGVKIEETDGDVCLRVDTSKGNSAANLHKMLFAWLETAKKFYDGNITKEEYDEWRYHYPEFDTTQKWVKVPSQQISDIFTEAKKSSKSK